MPYHIISSTVVQEEDRDSARIKYWCDLDLKTQAQAEDVARHPAIIGHVALMPDAHMGYGMPIGGVACLDRAVSPNMVGVDIGCGMTAMRTGHTVAEFTEKQWNQILRSVRNRIPVGFNRRNPDGAKMSKWHSIPLGLYQREMERLIKLNHYTNGKTCPDSVWEQIGTLGGGNHFIEFQKNNQDEVCVMIHSGSRNIGKQIADYHNKVAVRLCKAWKICVMKDLAYLPLDTAEGKDYMGDMQFAMVFAAANRRVMMQIIYRALVDAGIAVDGMNLVNMIDIHHNYAVKEHHYGNDVLVHRKGATLARKGTIGIIPGSMGTSSYIVEGLGNQDSYHSCSHGAGRAMGRRKAKETIKFEDFKQAMKDVRYTPIAENLDEAPQAYKDIDDVMNRQKDLVRIRAKLTPLAVVKG